MKSSVKFNSPEKCPYCHDSDLSGQNFRACSACKARQHKKCWDDHGACASCGEPAKKKKEVVVKSSKGIPPTKMVFAITVILAGVLLAIKVPDSQAILAIMLIFGFGSFMDWLDR